MKSIASFMKEYFGVGNIVKLGTVLSLYSGLAVASPLHTLQSTADPETKLDDTLASLSLTVAQCIYSRNISNPKNSGKSPFHGGLYWAREKLVVDGVVYSVQVEDIDENHPYSKENKAVDSIEVLRDIDGESHMFTDHGLDGRVDGGTDFKFARDPTRRGFLISDRYGEHHRIDIHPKGEPSGKDFFQPHLDEALKRILSTCVMS